MDSTDTIFALSSGAPPAAIAIIRISGAQAFSVVQALAGRVPLPRRASLAILKHPASQETLDQALVLIFPGPDSATGEDLAELHLHGGRAVVRAVEDAIGSLDGLRRAEPGEFTRRAFEHGRIDLNEAEGLGDLLAAETEWQRRAANMMFGGSFSRAVEHWRQEVLRLSALTEAELDFSDESDVDDQNNVDITDACVRFSEDMQRILSGPSTEKLKDGFRVVLAGPPNVGKSTLLNALVGREAAIVSDIAGTTRDMIDVPVALDGVAVIFTDTAGLRDSTPDVIERIGIDRSLAALNEADIILWLGQEGGAPPHPYVIEVAPKSDGQDFARKSEQALRVSAVTGEGMGDLMQRVLGTARELLPLPNQFAVNTRQRQHISDCAAALAACGESDDWLIVAENLRLARISLDALTGRAHTEELLDTLFGKFCVGK